MKFETLFTPEEANNMLPLVKKIVADILENGRKIKDSVEHLKDSEIYATIKPLKEEQEELLVELQELGCFYQDPAFNVGLVDFPCTIDDEVVFLCWKNDEEDIRFFHKIDEGFAGRQMIPAKYFTEAISL